MNILFITTLTDYRKFRAQSKLGWFWAGISTPTWQPRDIAAAAAAAAAASRLMAGLVCVDRR